MLGYTLDAIGMYRLGLKISIRTERKRNYEGEESLLFLFESRKQKDEELKQGQLLACH